MYRAPTRKGAVNRALHPKENPMKIILKPLDNPFGQTDACHVAELVTALPLAGEGRVHLMSYASKDAFEAGRPSTCSRDVFVKLDDLATFPALWTEIAARVLSDPASPFAGGELSDAEAPQ
jgi:hypothetical protein